MTFFLRGAGGFSKSSEPYSYSNYSTDKVSAVKIPESQPFTVFEDCTQPSQACVIYFIINAMFCFSLYAINFVKFIILNVEREI
jgi:hypothetical protein